MSMKEAAGPRLRLATNEDSKKVTDLVYTVLREYVGDVPGDLPNN